MGGGFDGGRQLLLVLVSLLEGGAFFKASTALDSCRRESWIF